MTRVSALLSLLIATTAAGQQVSTGAKTLVVCDDIADPLTLDPHKEFAEKNHTLLQQMYEGLVRIDARGRIEPALALSWERMDPLRMRFHLRPGVKFHDGEPFDAEAVRFSIARYLDPKTGFPALGFLAPLDHVDVVDAQTADVITRLPDGLLLNRLAGFVLIVPPRYVKEHGVDILESAPVGTGPFRFERWVRGKEISMTRNDSYWAPQYPKVDRLVFRFLRAEDQLAALKSGEIDVSTEFPGTQTTEAMRTGLLKVIKAPSFYTVTGSLNTSQQPLSDVRVRRALNFALNKDDLVRYDLLGNGRAIATVTMDGEEGHNPDLKPYPYDLSAARKLLREAGYAKGFTLKALVKYQGERAAKIMSTQLSRVGVTLDVHMISDAAVVQALTNGRWDVFIAGCPDPMAHSYFIQSIYLYGHSPYRVAENADYDRLLDQMVSTLNDDRRRELARSLDRYMYDQSLLLFLYQRLKTYGVRKGIDFVPSVTGMPYFFAVSKGAATE